MDLNINNFIIAVSKTEFIFWMYFKVKGWAFILGLFLFLERDFWGDICLFGGVSTFCFFGEIGDGFDFTIGFLGGAFEETILGFFDKFWEWILRFFL